MASETHLLLQDSQENRLVSLEGDQAPQNQIEFINKNQKIKSSCHGNEGSLKSWPKNNSEIHSLVEKAKSIGFCLFSRSGETSEGMHTPLWWEFVPDIVLIWPPEELSSKNISPGPARQKFHLSKTSYFLKNTLRMLLPFHILVAPSAILPLCGNSKFRNSLCP